MMGRVFTKKITEQQLASLILSAWVNHPDYKLQGDDSTEQLNSIENIIEEYNVMHSLTPQIENDMEKVDVCFENIQNKEIKTLNNGLVAQFVYGGGDWEQGLYYIVYYDGIQLRAYIPTKGNLWNTKEKSAYGNNDSDTDNARKRGFLRKDQDEDDLNDVEPNLLEIEKDIVERIKYKE
jgi:hypothetical protein